MGALFAALLIEVGRVLTVPDGQDSGVVDDNRFLTLKKQVRFRGCTEIVECDASTARGFVECESWEDQNWLYRPTVDKKAGARYKQCLEWYLCDKDCVLCKKGCQFWWGICVDRGCTTPTFEVTR